MGQSYLNYRDPDRNGQNKVTCLMGTQIAVDAKSDPALIWHGPVQ